MRQFNLAVNDLLTIRANIISACQYHQNELSKLRQRLKEIEEYLEDKGVVRSSVPEQLRWLLDDS